MQGFFRFHPAANEQAVERPTCPAPLFPLSLKPMADKAPLRGASTSHATARFHLPTDPTAKPYLGMARPHPPANRLQPRLRHSLLSLPGATRMSRDG